MQSHWESPKELLGLGKDSEGMAGAWQDWSRCWSWAEQGSLRAPSEPSWESQITRDSSNAMIHLHPDHHTKQPFLHRELKQVHEELIPGPASSVSQKSLLDEHWLPSAGGGKSCQKEKCIISLTNNLGVISGVIVA